MDNVAIRVQDLGKLYRIGQTVRRYRTLRDALTETALGAEIGRAHV